MDTPQDILAKTRFQKYRGLESFRTSPWDPKENLPVDYSRIIEFADYDRRRKRIYKECEDIEEAIWVTYAKKIFFLLYTYLDLLLNIFLNNIHMYT